MDVREALVELLADHCDMKDKGCIGCEKGLQESVECKNNKFGKVADHLVAHGVMVRQGHWIWHEDSSEYECSTCDCRFDYNKLYELPTYFKWNSTKDNLPPERTPVICYSPKTNNTFIGYYMKRICSSGVDWYLLDPTRASRSSIQIVRIQVTHWMYCPEIPKD